MRGIMLRRQSSDGAGNAQAAPVDPELGRKNREMRAAVDNVVNSRVKPGSLLGMTSTVNEFSEETAAKSQLDFSVRPLPTVKHPQYTASLWRIDNLLTDYLVALSGSDRAIPLDDYRENPLNFTDFIYEEGLGGRKGVPPKYWSHRLESETWGSGESAKRCDVWRTPDNTTFTSDAVAVRTFYELGGHSLLPDVVSVELSVNKLVETHSVDGMECDFSVLVTTRWYDPHFHSPEFANCVGQVMNTRSIPYITIDGMKRVATSGRELGDQEEAGDSEYASDPHSGQVILSEDGDPPGVLCHKQHFRSVLQAVQSCDGQGRIGDFPYDSMDFELHVKLQGSATVGDTDCSRVLLPLDFRVNLDGSAPPNWQVLPLRVRNLSKGSRGVEQHLVTTVSLQRKPQLFIRRVFLPFSMIATMSFLAFPFNLQKASLPVEANTTFSNPADAVQNPDEYDDRIGTVLLVLFTLITYQQSFSTDHLPVVSFLTTAVRNSPPYGVALRLESMVPRLTGSHLRVGQIHGLLPAFVLLVCFSLVSVLEHFFVQSVNATQALELWCLGHILHTIVSTAWVGRRENDSTHPLISFAVGTVAIVSVGVAAKGATWVDVFGDDQAAVKVDKCFFIALFTAWICYIAIVWFDLQSAKTRTKKSRDDWQKTAKIPEFVPRILKGDIAPLYEPNFSSIRRRWLLSLGAFRKLVNHELNQRRSDPRARKGRSFPTIPFSEELQFSPVPSCECRSCQSRRGLRSSEAEEMRLFLAKSDLAQMSGPIADILDSARITVRYLQQVYENGQVDLTNVLRKAGVLTTSHAVRITSAIADAVRIDTVRRRQDAVSRADSVRRGREDKATRKQRAMNYDATDETDGEDAPFKAPSFLALQGSPTYLWRAMGIEGHVLPMSLVFRRLNDELEDIYMCEEFVQPCEERDMRDKLDVLANLMMSLEILLTELGNFEYVFALRTFKGDVSYFGEQPVYLHTQLWSGYLATLPRQLWPESEDSRKDGVTPENASLALVIEIGSGTIKYRLARREYPIDDGEGKRVSLDPVVTDHAIEGKRDEYNVKSRVFFEKLQALVQNLEAPHHLAPQVGVESDPDDVQFSFEVGSVGESFFTQETTSMSDLYDALGVEGAVNMLLREGDRDRFKHAFLIGTGTLRKLREVQNRMPDGALAWRHGNRLDEIISSLGQYCGWKLGTNFNCDVSMSTHILTGEEESHREFFAYAQALKYAHKYIDPEFRRRRGRLSSASSAASRAGSVSRSGGKRVKSPSGRATDGPPTELTFKDISASKRSLVQNTLWKPKTVVHTCGWGHGTCQYSCGPDVSSIGGTSGGMRFASIPIGLSTITTRLKEFGLVHDEGCDNVEEIVDVLRQELRKRIRQEAPFLGPNSTSGRR